MSKSLKDLIASDIDLVFMQLEDFGEVHKIEGKSITIIIDNDTLVTMKNGNILGVAESDTHLYLPEPKIWRVKKLRAPR